MKFCIVMPNHWSGALGGAELQVRYFVDHLQRNSRHQLSMLCRLSAMSDDGDMPIYLTSAPKILKRYTQLGEWASIDRQLRRLDPDVVYTRTSGAYVGFVARYCRRYGKRHVHHIAHMEDVLPGRLVIRRSPLARLDRPIYEYGLRSADAIIAQAEYQARLLEMHFGRSCSAVIPNFHPAPPDVMKDCEGRLVVWVSNLKPAKQPEAFIELANRCAGKLGTQFLMVGAIQDPKYRYVESYTQANGSVRYLGSQSLEEVSQLLTKARLFVNTSQEAGEGFPNTFIQAWLRRVPVVSLHVNPDRLLDGARFGVYCGGSMDRLEENVLDLMANQEKLEALGAEARRLALRMFGPDNCWRLQSVLEGRLAT